MSLPVEIWTFVIEFATYADAASLRVANKEMLEMVKLAKMVDGATEILKVDNWLQCFPNALCLKLGNPYPSEPVFPFKRLTHLRSLEIHDCNMCWLKEATPFAGFHLVRLSLWECFSESFITNDFFKCLAGIQELNMGHTEDAFNLETVTDDAFAYIKGIRVLRISSSYDLKITKAAMQHLRGIESLSLYFLKDDCVVDDSFFEPLRGIKKLEFKDCHFDITDAAFFHIRGITELSITNCDASYNVGLSKLTSAALHALDGIMNLVLCNTRLAVQYQDLSAMNEYAIIADEEGIFHSAVHARSQHKGNRCDCRAAFTIGDTTMPMTLECITYIMQNLG